MRKRINTRISSPCDFFYSNSTCLLGFLTSINVLKRVGYVGCTTDEQSIKTSTCGTIFFIIITPGDIKMNISTRATLKPVRVSNMGFKTPEVAERWEGIH